MKLLITLILVVAASTADDELLVVSREFVQGMVKLQVPPKLARGVDTEEFVRKYAFTIESMLNDFVVEYYEQAFRGQRILVRDFKSATERLLEPSRGNSSVILDVQLTRVNELLRKLLKCLPGRVSIKRKGFPELPVPEEVSTHLGNEELSDLFVNMAANVDRDISTMHNLVDSLFLAGWRNSRPSLNQLQDHFRSNILNGDILPSFAEELVKISEAGDAVRQHVNSETWEVYIQLNEQVNRALRSLDA